MKNSPVLSLTFTAATAPGASTATWDLFQDTPILTQDRCTDSTGLVTLTASIPDTIWVSFHLEGPPTCEPEPVPANPVVYCSYNR